MKQLFLALLLALTTQLGSAQDISKWKITDYSAGTNVAKEIANDVKIKTQGIASLTADSFIDLAFLKQELRDKQIVFLGENTHTGKEYQQLKIRLIKYLHEEMGFKIIAFESSMAAGYFASENRSSLTPKEIVLNSMHKTAQSEELLALMSYLQANKSLKLIGFDNQQRQNNERTIDNIAEQIALIDETLSIEYRSFMPMFLAHTEVVPFHQSKSYYLIKDSLNLVLQRLINHAEKLPFPLIIQRHFVNIQNTFKQYSAKNMDAGVAFRDSCMGANINWIADQLYPNEKMICWGHNIHISKDVHESTYQESAGRLVYEKYPNKTYHIGFYAYQGSHGLRSVTKLPKVKSGSIEAILHTNQYKYSFTTLFDVNKDNWVNTQLKSSYLGYFKEIFIPSKAYDGIIFIHSLSAPNYF